MVVGPIFNCQVWHLTDRSQVLKFDLPTKDFWHQRRLSFSLSLSVAYFFEPSLSWSRSIFSFFRLPKSINFILLWGRQTLKLLKRILSQNLSLYQVPWCLISVYHGPRSRRHKQILETLSYATLKLSILVGYNKSCD